MAQIALERVLATAGIDAGTADDLTAADLGLVRLLQMTLPERRAALRAVNMSYGTILAINCALDEHRKDYSLTDCPDDSSSEGEAEEKEPADEEEQPADEEEQLAAAPQPSPSMPSGPRRAACRPLLTLVRCWRPCARRTPGPGARPRAAPVGRDRDVRTAAVRACGQKT